MKMFAATLLLLSIFIVPTVAAQPYLIENSTWQKNLVAVEFASSAWGDIDNDGDSDLALTGCTYYGGSGCTSYVSRIYVNNGTTLVDDSSWGQNLTAMNYGSLAWGDVDNDGDLDLAAIGCNDGGGGPWTHVMILDFNHSYT